MMTPCFLFAVNMFMLKIVVRAEVVADGQGWTHRDTAPFDGAKDALQQNRNAQQQISPRMDFDEWTPLGRGDPLKNDPTFDYLPPVLEKVHYWKSPPSPARAHPSSTAASVAVQPSPQAVVHYNRRFFLTDFSSKREPAVYAQYKRPAQAVAAAAAGYPPPPPHYPMPRVPLPMLTPPPYHRPAAPLRVTVAGAAAAVTVEPSSDSFASDPGDSAAESKQPPTVRAPPPPHLPPHLPPPHLPPPHLPPPHNTASAGVRPAPSHSFIMALLENEVDRTTVTTAMTTDVASTTAATTAASTAATAASTSTTSTTTAAASTTDGTTRAPPTTDPLFAHYKQSAVQATGRPMMYLIIQGHSKVKTYGLVSKSDDLSAQPAAAVQDHNHIGNRPPDEPSRRKRDGPRQ